MQNKSQKPTVAIIGLGLIGGSLALELKKHRLASKVIGISTSAKNRNLALKLKAVDEAYAASDAKLSTAHIVFVCTPVKTIEKILVQLKTLVKKDCIVSDVGSSKLEIVNTAKKLKLNFVGGHPIAGTEKSGMVAAELNLFKNKKWVLTSDFAPANSIKTLSKLLSQMGAVVKILKAKEHDELLAAFSHVPNLVSYALAASVNKSNLLKNIQYSGRSIKDMTRLAESPIEMWRDIALSNSSAVLKALKQFELKLSAFRKAVESKNTKALEKCLDEGKRGRAFINS